MHTDRQWTRARLHLIVIAIIAAVLTGSLLFPQNAFAAPTASPAAGAAKAAATYSVVLVLPAGATTAELTQYVYDATNEVRYAKGLKGYARDARLDKVAQAWALKQWQNGKMSHNPSYSKQIPKGWTRAGENVASGYTSTQVVDAWMASPSHKANLMNDYTSIGIGYYESGGKRYWVQNFAKYPGTKQPTKPAAPRPSYPAEPAPPAGPVLSLASPSFEASLAGWVAPGAALDGPTTGAKGGRYALAVSGSKTVTQSASTKPNAGATYTGTIWVKAGSTSAVSGSLRLTALGGTTETATMGFTVSPSTGWMKVSVPLKLANAGHTGFKIEAVLGSGDFRLDSASIVRTATPAPAAKTAPPPASRH